MRNFLRGLLLLLTSTIPTPPRAQDDPIDLSNVDVFDGVNEALMEDVNIVVMGNVIPEISSDDIAVAGGQVNYGTGHTLMLSIFEGDSHLALSGITFGDVLCQQQSYETIQSVFVSTTIIYVAPKAREPTLVDRYGLNSDAGTALKREVMLAVAILAAGVMASVVSAIRVYRMTLADGLSFRL